jgi:hypothetical protein
MVRTTTGPAEHGKTREVKEAKPTSEDRQMERISDLDDETWNRIESLAKSQSITPAEVVRRALTQTFGAQPTTEGFNTGVDTSANM